MFDDVTVNKSSTDMQNSFSFALPLRVGVHNFT